MLRKFGGKTKSVSRQYTDVRRAREAYMEAHKEDPVDLWADRPVRRSDCAGVCRPCPYVSCKWNNYLEVGANGSIRYTFGEIDPLDVPSDMSCAMDLIERMAVDIDVDQDGMTLEAIALVFSLCRERVRQLEVGIFIDLRERLGLVRDFG